MAEDMFVRQMKRLRAKLGLTQLDLAERVASLGGSMYQQTIAKIESGTRAVRIAEADLIARALESSVAQMLEEEIVGIGLDGAEAMAIEDLVARSHATQRRMFEIQGDLDQANVKVLGVTERLRQAEREMLLARVEASRIEAIYRDQWRQHKFFVEAILDRSEEMEQLYGESWREQIGDDPR